MKPTLHNKISVFGAASPSRVAVLLNVIIALIVSTAVALHLRTQRTQALQEVQAQVANMAHAQALLIGNQLSSYDGLLKQLEIRLNVAELNARRTRDGKMEQASESEIHALLRDFHDMAVGKKDLLLVSADGTYHAASDLLETQNPLSRYCKGLDAPSAAPRSSALLVYTAETTGRCPAPGTLILQKALVPQEGKPQRALWLLFDPEGFQSTLQRERLALDADVQYRVVDAGQTVLLSSTPATDSARWHFPAVLDPQPLLADVRTALWQDPTEGHWISGVQAAVRGTGLQVQMVYRTEEAITPVWRPVAQLWGSLAAGFLFIWWVVSFLVVQMVRKHQTDIQVREERFDRSLDYAELGVWDWDIPSGNLYWSQRVGPLLGLPETMQESFDDVFMKAVHPDDRALVEQAIERSLQAGAPYVVELRVVWPDQTVHWLREWGNVQRDSQGKAIRMLGVTQDITAQRAALSHQRLLETVVSQLNDLVCITDAQKAPQDPVRIIFLNQAFAEQTGYQPDQALGLPLEQLFDAHNDPAEMDRLRLALARKEPLRAELLVARNQGEPHWMEINLQPLREPDGSVSNWVLVARDTSQRKLAESELRGSENRLSGVLESAMDAIISVDESHRIVLFNAAAERTFGHRSEAMLGQPLDVLLPQGLRALHARHLHSYHHNALEQTNNRIMAPRSNLKAVRANGQEFPIEASISRAQVSSGVIFTVILRDTTERMEAERRLRDLNETLEQRVAQRTRELQEAVHSAEQAKRSRGDFLAKMSHEIRTPMNAVLGMTHLALQSDPTPVQAGFLGKIQHAGQHLLHTINDILDFSKIDAGKLHIEKEVFDLQQAIRDGIQMTEGRAIEKSLALEVHIASEVPRCAAGDALRLVQVLINYINNAIKFSSEGPIAIRARVVEDVGTGTPGEPFTLQVEVEDHGIGMSASQMEHLFESFEQADNSTTRRFGGTGLGLAICKQLATLMGGAVGVRSQEGVGSVFWFTVRLQHCEQGLSGSREQDQEALLSTVRGRCVLVVDDNEMNVEVAVGVLQSWGVQALQAYDGLQALHVLRAQAVDLVLMDMHMPNMDGLEACRVLRADQRLQALPVIAMTANARTEDHALCLQAGMNEVVTKPFVPNHLLKVLGRWLRQPTAQQPLGKTPSTAPAPAHAPVADKVLPPLWDATRLGLFVGNNPAHQARLLHKFLVALEEFADKLRFPEAPNGKTLAQSAHKIKSSARTVGALRLADLCEQLEIHGNAANSAECGRLLLLMDDCIPETRAAITAQVQSLEGSSA